jgi:predicted TIM-barrel fold metal-dependent hydrolase
MRRREFLVAGAATGSAESVAAAQSRVRIDAYCTVGVDREYNLTAESLLRRMDAAGVSRAVIAPVDRQMVVLNREGNEFIRKTAGAHRTRLIPACSVNPWFGKAALDEFRRAAGAGARMLVLHPQVQGFQSNDELVFPLIEAAAKERMPTYIHTGPPGAATPFQIVDLAHRFPQALLIMGHCGATDFWNDAIVAAQAAPGIFLESSMARPFHFSNYMKAVGSKRGLMGSWAPLNDLEFEWEQMAKFLPETAWNDVFGGNLMGLLSQRGAL